MRQSAFVIVRLLLLKRNATSAVPERKTRVIIGKDGSVARAAEWNPGSGDLNGSHRSTSDRHAATGDPSQFIGECSELWSSQERSDHV